MANITKKVTRGIPSPTQYWSTTADLNDSSTPIVAGDVFKINDSLLGPASEVVITTTSAGSMSFRTNPFIQLFPSRPDGEFMYDPGKFIASGVTHTDTSQSPIVVPASNTITLSGPINDLQLVTVSGAFTLRAKR
jgi:hypothetical protein